MHHLSGLDASLLCLETPEQPMHVGSLNIYELSPGFERDFVETLRQYIGARMHLAPVFQRKLVNMPFELANPVWVADDDIDMEYHIRSTVLPKPGSRAQLDKLVGRLHSSLLDRSRPLWEFYVIEGVQSPADYPPGTRHAAFYSKVHHAALDGAGGIALAPGEASAIGQMRADIPFLERLGSELTRPVLPRSAAIDYLPSQYLCEFIKKSGYDGVVFRSSVSSGINLALFNPLKATGGAVSLYSITRVSVDVQQVRPESVVAGA